MTKEELTKLMNGREYCEEISREEEKLAKENGLVVIFGASDDLVEIRGAIRDEIDGAGDFYLCREGIPGSDCGEGECCPYYQRELKCRGHLITALWCNGEDYSWTYETTIPHATFDILDEGEKYCRGIVLDVSELPEWEGWI